MDTASRILAFSELGRKLNDQLTRNDENLNDAILNAKNGNQWFTEENIKFSLN